MCCGQVAGWIMMSLGMEVVLGPGDFVLDGDLAPPPQKGGGAAQFLSHVYCGQTVGWIKMALGMEVGLGPGHIVLDGYPVPLPQKGAEPPIFGPFLLWPDGWMYQDTTWYGSKPRPRPHCVRRGPSSPHNRGTGAPVFFDPCLLRPRSPISATAKLYVVCLVFMLF